MKPRRNLLAEKLNELLSLANGEAVSLGKILHVLAGRGQAVLLILFSLPFCQPIQIPGFSTPFGILLCFIGLRIAFGHKVWLPKTILERQISFKTLKKISEIAVKITNKLRFLISTRLTWLVTNPFLHLIHGLMIALLGVLLALPIPFPMTNFFTAYPILAFGLAFLEDDGVMIIIAYALSLICLLFFASLIWFGKEGFEFLYANGTIFP